MSPYASCGYVENRLRETEFVHVKVMLIEKGAFRPLNVMIEQIPVGNKYC